MNDSLDNNNSQKQHEGGKNQHHRGCGSGMCCYGMCGRGHRNFWAWFLILFGGYFLAKDLGLLPSDFSLWPLFLLGMGGWMLMKKR